MRGSSAICNIFQSASQNNPFTGPQDVTVSDSFQLPDHLEMLCYFKGKECVKNGAEKKNNTSEFLVDAP